VSRGDGEHALTFLDGVSHTSSLMLKADLLHDHGRIAPAVAVIERVLARNIDTPGARERHARWRSTLAPQVSRTRTNDDVTMAVPSLQQTPFRILREAARGGAGTVYEARDDVIGRALALKVYHQVAMDRPQIRREAQVAVRLAGPGVVRVYDADFEAGWIALEWLPRGSLREVIRRETLAELGSPAAFAGGLARALARVHGQGWVHADVKPANVLIGESGTPLLSDFGIAVRVGEGSVGGSAGFLSPERLAGSPLSPSDDVYGFGRILEDAAATGSTEWSGMRRVAERCMSPVGTRPDDGRGLLALMDSE
jgi:serine/threonine-protein kinase